MSHDDYLGDASPRQIGRRRAAEDARGALAVRFGGGRPPLGPRWNSGLLTAAALALALAWVAGQLVGVRPAVTPALVEPPRLEPLREVTVDVAAIDRTRPRPLTWNDLFDLYGLEQPLQIRTLEANAVDGRRPDPSASIGALQVKLVLSGYSGQTS
jgi:hypothetical protein